MAARPLLALFEETSAPLTRRAAADEATLLDDRPLIQNIVQVGERLETQTAALGVTELGQLP